MSPSLPAQGLLGLIQLYKWTLSPLVGQGCRYRPTCSSYAADAIRLHGAWAGSWMTGARLCRCAPWGGHGWDPAPPEIKTNSWWRPWRYGDWRGGYRPPPEDVSRHDGEAPCASAAEADRAASPRLEGEGASRPLPPAAAPRRGGGR